MGQMRFHTPRRENVSPHALERAYLVGIDGVPWRSRSVWSSNETHGPAEFVIERSVRESGNLVIPWRVEGYGERMMSTASLMERPEAYHLPVELARGAVSRLRAQLFEWQTGDVAFSESTRILMKAATQHFVRAATAQANPLEASLEAQQVLALTAQLADLLCAEYASQIIATRRRETPRLPTLFGGAINPLATELNADFLGTFNTACMQLTWRDIEATADKPEWSSVEKLLDLCRSNGLRIAAGPLMSLDENNVPDWVYLWQDDFDHLQTCILAHVRGCVQRLKGKVQLWNVASRINVRGNLDVTEEQNLRLVVSAIDTVRAIDSRTPIVLSFDQPWAEMLAVEDSELSPLHFADSLARADLGLSGLGLELNIGYWPGGTLPRDVLDISRQIDRWSVLGLPLLIFLNVASRDGDDPRARFPAKVVPGTLAGTSPESQGTYVRNLIEMFLAKPLIQGIFWNEYSDALPHAYAHAGLYDHAGAAKPVLGALRELRDRYLA